MPEAETDFYWEVCKLSYTGLCELAKVITAAPSVTLLPTAETALPDFLAQRRRFISEFGSDWHEILSTELTFLNSPKGGKCFQKGALPTHVKNASQLFILSLMAAIPQSQGSRAIHCQRLSAWNVASSPTK